MRTVAALYIEPRGPYPRIPGVDCWDEKRDARLYDGTHPVVAHPPCGPWGRLRHRYRGSEHDCAPRAVEQVRRWGGVLEHPAGSKLWEACEIPVPRDRFVDGERTFDLSGASCADKFGGYTIEVHQVEWGHVARKRTWLYLVGVPRRVLEDPPFPGRKPSRSVSGRRGLPTQAKHPTWREQLPRCSDAQRLRTPPLFAEYLIRLARAACR